MLTQQREPQDTSIDYLQSILNFQSEYTNKPAFNITEISPSTLVNYLQDLEKKGKTATNGHPTTIILEIAVDEPKVDMNSDYVKDLSHGKATSIYTAMAAPHANVGLLGILPSTTIREIQSKPLPETEQDYEIRKIFIKSFKETFQNIKQVLIESQEQGKDFPIQSINLSIDVLLSSELIYIQDIETILQQYAQIHQSQPIEINRDQAPEIRKILQDHYQQTLSQTTTLQEKMKIEGILAELDIVETIEEIAQLKDKNGNQLLFTIAGGNKTASEAPYKHNHVNILTINKNLPNILNVTTQHIEEQTVTTSGPDSTPSSKMSPQVTTETKIVKYFPKYAPTHGLNGTPGFISTVGNTIRTNITQEGIDLDGNPRTTEISHKNLSYRAQPAFQLMGRDPYAEKLIVHDDKFKADTSQLLQQLLNNNNTPNDKPIGLNKLTIFPLEKADMNEIYQKLNENLQDQFPTSEVFAQYCKENRVHIVVTPDDNTIHDVRFVNINTANRIELNLDLNSPETGNFIIGTSFPAPQINGEILTQQYPPRTKK